MIKKPIGYDDARTYDGTGSSEQPTPGGHYCVIKGARVEINPNTQQQVLILALDMAPNDKQAGLYDRAYKARMASPSASTEIKWPGTYRQGIDNPKSVPFFKGMISSIEESNPGYTWDWDERSLKGKTFGGVFGREEFSGTDGKPHWSCKCVAVRSTKSVMDAPVPEDKPLAGGGTGYAPHAPSVQMTLDDPSSLPF